MDAIDWCSRMGVSLSFVASDSTLLNCMIPDAPHDGPVKRAQAVSAVSDDAFRLARYLLTKKMESQIAAIQTEFGKLHIGNATSRNAAVAEISSCRQGLMESETLVDFLALEGRAAQVYWELLVATPLPWRRWALKRIPAHWAAISPRTNGRRERVRDATDPFNAILNYSYTLLEIETRIACEATGLDPDLGLIHVDDRLRESFIYDLLEPLRPMADVWVLELLRREQLHPSMFHELRDGIVRLDPDVTEVLAKSLMPRFAKQSLKLASEYAQQLRQVPVHRKLVREGFKPRGTKHESPNKTRCGYCKEPLQRKRLKYCGRECYLRYSVEIAKPIEKAQAKLAEMRSTGLSPGHGGEAAKKRGAKIAKSNQRRTLALSPQGMKARRAEQQRARRRSKRASRDGLSSR